MLTDLHIDNKKLNPYFVAILPVMENCHRFATNFLCTFENFTGSLKTKNLQNIDFAGFTILFKSFALFCKSVKFNKSGEDGSRTPPFQPAWLLGFV
jgi:hypothetical protein